MAVSDDGSGVPTNDAGVPLTDVAPSNELSYRKSATPPSHQVRYVHPSLQRWMGQCAFLMAIVYLLPHELIFNFMFHRVCGGNRHLYIQLNNAILQCMYWSVGLALYWMNANEKLLQYRLTAVSRTRKFNFLYMLPLTVLGMAVSALGHDGDDTLGLFVSPLQSGWRLLAGLVLMELAYEVALYVFHRLTHQFEFLYKVVHARHHSVYPLISLDTLYFHPLDNLSHNLLPLSFAQIVTANTIGLHVHTLWVMLFGLLLLGLEDHSGYSFPVSPFRWLAPLTTSEHHLRHHTSPSTNFSYYVWDWMGGTNWHQHYEEKGFKGHISSKQKQSAQGKNTE